MNKRLQPSDFTWFKKPSLSFMNGGKLVIETEPHTKFQPNRTGEYGAFGMHLEPTKPFALTMRIDYVFRGIDDELGIFLYKDNSHWITLGLENLGDTYELACTLYENGYKDRSNRELGTGIKWIYLKIVYWKGNASLYYSFHGVTFKLIRTLHFEMEDSKIHTGMYACSPGNSYYDATFSEIMYEEI